ncbi:MAG: hypothetical protein IJT02_08255 [Synergistaceae bacterium]|nr:hypothetical protein [Synergistaceae bacterium]
MTELDLLDALVERLSGLFMGYELKGKSGLLQEVKVIPQYLPQPSSAAVKSDEEDEEIEPQGYTADDIESIFPCVIVRIGEVIDREEGTRDQTRINVNFIVGVYDEAKNCQGYRDVYNIIEVIRQDLLTIDSRVLNNRYRLEMPMTSDLAREQEWPIYFGYIETVWETGRPMMTRNFGGRLPPYGRG